ncbi:MAG TPA: uroporphyrinogen decarboxylase family protein [Spirochaetia bacterium]|nr:uroporphyrinogen decarboxylase family protein [Spirochaetia bacterium]
MNSEERIIQTLHRSETDRIPSFEWVIDRQVINAMRPGASEEGFIYQEDLDAVCVDLDYTREEIEPGLFRDEWGRVTRHSAEAHPYPLRGPISCMEELRRYEYPDPANPARYASLERSLSGNAGKKAVILHLNDVFSLPSRLMKFEDFMMCIVLDPKLARALVDLSVEANLAFAREARGRGVKIIYTGDDYAYNSGPMVSPAAFREIFFPGLKRVVAGYKELGLLVIKHTDGDIMPIIDMIVDAGFDCLDPIDPVAGMDLETVKERFGNRIAIKGNVDCANLLTFGSPEEVRRAAEYCILTGGRGGGYIFSSSNSIHSSVKPENYRAMLDTWIELRERRAG